MEPYSYNALRLTILVCWIVGLFPTQSAFLTSKNFRFKWFCLGTIIAVVPIVLSCMNICSTSLIVLALHDQPSAVKLVFIFATASALIYSAVARFVSFILCSKLVSLIQLLEQIRIYCLKSNSVPYESNARKMKGRLSVGFCLILGWFTGGYVWFHAREVIRGDTSNPLIAAYLKQGSSVVHKFNLIFGYCNPVVTQRVIIASILCIGHYLLWAHEQVSYFLQHSLEMSGTVMDHNSNGRDANFGLDSMKNFEKLKTCFHMYSDVLGRQILLITVATVGMVTYSVYFMLWPADGKISELAVPSGLLNPMLILWIGNCMENQVKEHGQKIHDAMIYARMRGLGEHSGLVLVATSFAKWEWKLRAWDILTVNYELLPSMIGALATCLIFLVQLRLSEFT